MLRGFVRGQVILNVGAKFVLSCQLVIDILVAWYFAAQFHSGVVAVLYGGFAHIPQKGNLKDGAGWCPIYLGTSAMRGSGDSNGLPFSVDRQEQPMI